MENPPGPLLGLAHNSTPVRRASRSMGRSGWPGRCKMRSMRYSPYAVSA